MSSFVKRTCINNNYIFYIGEDMGGPFGKIGGTPSGRYGGTLWEDFFPTIKKVLSNLFPFCLVGLGGLVHLLCLLAILDSLSCGLQ